MYSKFVFPLFIIHLGDFDLLIFSSKLWPSSLCYMTFERLIFIWNEQYTTTILISNSLVLWQLGHRYFLQSVRIWRFGQYRTKWKVIIDVTSMAFVLCGEVNIIKAFSGLVKEHLDQWVKITNENYHIKPNYCQSKTVSYNVYPEAVKIILTNAFLLNKITFGLWQLTHIFNGHLKMCFKIEWIQNKTNPYHQKASTIATFKVFFFVC